MVCIICLGILSIGNKLTLNALVKQTKDLLDGINSVIKFNFCKHFFSF